MQSPLEANAPSLPQVTQVIEIIAFATIWQFNLKVAKQIERDRDAWFNTSDVGWHSLNNS